MGHRHGQDRGQATLFPLMLDELVSQDALVRVVDAWVQALDLKALGFAKAQAQRLGTPPYDPGDLLRLYLWGYLSAIRSSRALERECHRNVECMWLLGRLAPDHKTIAEFRRQNTAGLVASCAAFVQFARASRLIRGSTVAIDGSKVQAVASRKAVVGQRELAAQAQRNAQEIAAYLRLLDSRDSEDDQDGEGPGGSPGAPDEVRAALERLKAEGRAIANEAQQLMRSEASTVVRGEPEARPMRSLNSQPGYNLQTAVETQSHLVVAHEVVCEVNDLRQLQPMAEAASRVLQQPCTVVADAGYANGQHIAALDAQGITSYVADNRSVNNQGGGGLYERDVFVYDRASDSFSCPAGKVLKRKQLSRTDKAVIYAAQPSDCTDCAHKLKCTTARQRFVSRHLYEEALQANASRLASKPWMMALRRQTVEHPFASIKHLILGNARLLMRHTSGARAEFSLAVMAYNLKRVFNMKGATWMHQALRG
ncbi:IS1182 family transposase [Variovorax sp. Root434]|uniref:IS1182 family transposase n=1 Tax=Variovorax sp. Root434 TaxID=1736536 RepID=UPI0009EABF54|nr:IS1182 family transposase [Variovorax sp. Root434]